MRIGIGLAIAIIGLLYFYTPAPSATFLVVVSVVLAVHVAIGNHILLGWINEVRHFRWCPEFLRKPDPWIAIGVTCLLLSILTGRAVGVQAGISTLAACAIIAGLVYMLAMRMLRSGSRLEL